MEIENDYFADFRDDVRFDSQNEGFGGESDDFNIFIDTKQEKDFDYILEHDFMNIKFSTGTNSHQEPETHFEEHNPLQEMPVALSTPVQQSVPSKKSKCKVRFKTLKEKQRKEKGKGKDRKFDPDGMRKKAKTHFLEDVREKLNKHLPENKQLIKLNQKLIQNINIPYNKILNNTKLYDIYIEDRSICKKRKIFDQEYNSKIIAEESLRNTELRELLNMKLKEFYTDFRDPTSVKIIAHLNEVRRKEGEAYYERYLKCFNEYVLYFDDKKGNTRNSRTNKRKVKH
jgi:hypothetical protein